MFKSREEIVKLAKEDPGSLVINILNNGEGMPISFSDIINPLIKLYISSGQDSMVSKNIAEIIADYFRHYFHNLIEIRIFQDYTGHIVPQSPIFPIDESLVYDKYNFNNASIKYTGKVILYNPIEYRVDLVIDPIHNYSNIGFNINNVLFECESLGKFPLALYRLIIDSEKLLNEDRYIKTNNGVYRTNTFLYTNVDNDIKISLDQGFRYHMSFIQDEFLNDTEIFEPIED